MTGVDPIETSGQRLTTRATRCIGPYITNSPWRGAPEFLVCACKSPQSTLSYSLMINLPVSDCKSAAPAAAGPRHVRAKDRFARGFLALFAVFGLALLPALAHATSPKSLLKRPRHWAAFIINEKGGTACYMVGRPISSKPKNVKRGKVWVLVTHRPYNKTRNVISVFSGYPYKPGSEVKASIDDKRYALVPKDETAWTKSSGMDAAMVEAMRAGNKLTVVGLSKRGTTTTDVFSLRGFTRAHDAIDKACGIR
jgi:hypothetical protein